ncbi:cell division protein FtsZ [Halobaculum roseum]|uniref:Cell division protein FtsZ n=1 Tax=Halobaculum roseum TaxID=2175149 RepID=A0ABD5MU57_9EURY|nr:cell division protein FtsZ [Halobaculum roseum]QZY04606.1 cell division protein FtsZ [Halobaculum roseum]
MTESCEICFTAPADWEEDSIEEHVLNAHGDAQPSVRAIYGDRFAHLFEEGTGEDGDGAGGADAPDAPAGGDAPTDLGGAEDLGPVSMDDDGEMYGRKWFLIGIGGAGNNIVDAVLMRRDTLARNHEDRARIWQGGLAGYGLLNTNIAELEQTYYTKELKEYSRNDLLSNSIIGFGKHGYSGMGYRWSNGAKVAAADFADGSNPFRDRWDMTSQDIRDAQAVMLVHSVTKGTGCGATPVIAEKLREEVQESGLVIDQAILSSVVIPSEGGQQSAVGGRAKTNGVIGLSRISRSADAIIPFNNDHLRRASTDIEPRIEGIDQYNPPEFADLNKPLVAFLEAFTMSSTPQLTDRDATMSIRGSVFDVADSFRLVEDKYPHDMAPEERPAVVLAPALGRLRSDDISRSSLELLARNTLLQNRLADFDPSTAWGGNFMIYGPEEQMSDVSEFVTDGTLQEILNGDEFLDAGSRSGVETVDVQLNQLVIPYLDDVFMWGTLWNPRMPSLESMYEHAKRLKDEGQSVQAEDIRDVWNEVQPLFDCLGRSNML